MLKSRENTAMNAAILCPAVCLSDVINKAEKHGNVHVVANVREPTIFCLPLVKNKTTWLHGGELKFDAPPSERAFLLYQYWQYNCNKYANETISIGGWGGGVFFMFSSQPVSLGQFFILSFCELFFGGVFCGGGG